MDSLSAVRRGPFRSPAKACSGKRKSTAGSVVWRSNRGCATVKLARCYSTAAGLFEHNSVPSTRHLPSFGELLKSPITFSWFLRPAPRKLLCFPLMQTRIPGDSLIFFTYANGWGIPAWPEVAFQKSCRTQFGCILPVVGRFRPGLRTLSCCLMATARGPGRRLRRGFFRGRCGVRG
jgi:hypothetical protein